MSTQAQRRAYTQHQATMNAMACNICGVKPTEAECIDADLEANVNKAERANQREQDFALVDQIDYLNKIGCDL